MIGLLIVETVLDNKLFKLGHFSADLLGKGAIQLLYVVNKTEKLVLNLSKMIRPAIHTLYLVYNVLIFFDWQHYYNYYSSAPYNQNIQSIQNHHHPQSIQQYLLQHNQKSTIIFTKGIILPTLFKIQTSMFRNCSKLPHTTRLLTLLPFHFTVRVRYAPSPTGFMHIGGLRTALFNYLLAKKHAGSFIVRIEDTDKNRQVEGSVQNIFETLKWVGITPDESILHGGPHGPYIQSERLTIYKNIEKQLLKSGLAFPCFCKEQPKPQNDKDPHPYNGACRKLTLQQIKTRIKNQQQYAVRIKSDAIGLPATFIDEVFGELQFKPFDDFVIVRKNGWPTFHFANVIDDWQMKITHVLRGEQWLTNTNKHIYLYKLLGAPIPKFVHLPLIKAMNGKKLAKRDPMSSIKFLQSNDYEIQAVKSMLATMGLINNQIEDNAQQTQQTEKNRKKNIKGKKQNKAKQQKTAPKSQVHKIISDSEMISEFDLSKISRVPVKFDKKQLDHLNRLAIKQKWKLAQIQSKQKEDNPQMKYFLDKLHHLIPSSLNYPLSYCIRMLSIVVDRLHFLSQLSDFKYYFEQPSYSDPLSQGDFQKLFGPNSTLIIIPNASGPAVMSQNCDIQLLTKNRKIVHNIRMILQHIIEPTLYNELQIAKRISEFLVQSPELKNEDVYHLLRFMVTARKSGPNIVQACTLIGRDKILQRIAPFSDL